MSVVRGDAWPWLPAYAIARPQREPGVGSRLWLIPLAGALLAPLITWLPMLAHRYPWTGLPRYEPARGIDIWHMQVLWAVAFAVVAALIGRQDRWLGAGLLFLGAGIFLWGGAVDITHRVVVLAGVLMLWAVRQTPRAWHPRVTALLAAAGIFQAVYILQQHMGYDLFWGPMTGGVLKPHLQPIGTLGTVDAASAYVAMTAPLMPWWALPVAIYVVLKGHSIGAIVALTAGLLIRLGMTLHRRMNAQGTQSRIPVLYPVALLLLLFAVWYAVYCPPHVPEVVKGRLGIWQFGLKDWIATSPLFGPGPWAARIPLLQMERAYRPTGEIFLEAHNEYLQWGYETGLIGMALLAGWAWRHRRAFFAGVTAPCLWALAINAGSFFVFHVVSVALAGLILVGLATSESSQEAA